MDPIYLDYNATTPLDPAVMAAMQPWLDGGFGNPSSGHAFGRQAADAVAGARGQVARLLGASAARDRLYRWGDRIQQPGDHRGGAGAGRTWPASGHLRSRASGSFPGVRVCFSARAGGSAWCRWTPPALVDPDDVARALCDDTVLVSIMHANNEVGTVQPIARIAELARAHGALLHTDAAQSVGKIQVDVADLGVDLLTVAGHKLYGPKGVGALYVRRGVQIQPVTHGADHEGGLRPGTENVLAIVGLGMACELAADQLAVRQTHARKLRDQLYDGLVARVEGVRRFGHSTAGLPNTLSIGFAGLAADALLAATPGVAASAGAACHSGHATISATLRAMAVPEAWARGVVRFSTGAQLTAPEVERAVELIGASVDAIRAAGN
jgi:cysteine desulfurase